MDSMLTKFFSLACFAPLNGWTDCGGGLAGSGFVGDNCTFSCDPGYMLQGSVTSGTCENAGSWSGGLPSCVLLTCPDRILFSDNSLLTPLFPHCNLTFQSECHLGCLDGYNGDNVTYLCNLTININTVEWMPIGGMELLCDPG